MRTINRIAFDEASKNLLSECLRCRLIVSLVVRRFVDLDLGLYDLLFRGIVILDEIYYLIKLAFIVLQDGR
jgi:hypothetical protein